SKDIVAMLLNECESAGVQIQAHCDIATVGLNGRFRITSNKGVFESESLVVATGGLSIPKMGASGFGYQLARQFGHDVIDTKAGLVPFTFTGAMHELTGRLSGVSATTTVRTDDAAFTEDLLFTHRGLSGPAILQLSSYWSPGDEILVDLLPGKNAADYLLDAKKAQPKSLLRSVLSAPLPRALVAEL
ncbi:MAG: aminoacetone oxidase family FAD-binding enzyme, partial [Gammaproteobacteria bacterium]|nr:aminoacetone oxidase family FAD-binding enzyme [Gammaproteobacteria bacterium]